MKYSIHKWHGGHVYHICARIFWYYACSMPWEPSPHASDQSVRHAITLHHLGYGSWITGIGGASVLGKLVFWK